MVGSTPFFQGSPTTIVGEGKARKAVLGLSTIFVAFYSKTECYQEGWKTYRFPSKSVWKTKKREKGKKREE